MELPDGPGNFPRGIPRDLSERIIKLHGDPKAWWIGQVVKYIMRYQPKTQQMIDEAMKEIKFRNPIVGIHARRTDKLETEATAHHAVDEYMIHAAEYFNQLELQENVDIRRIYLASEDPSALPEFKKK